MPSVPTTCLIVDDHAGFRTMARTLLESSGFDVVAEVADGVSAIAAVSRHHPDMVLLDVQLPDMDWFEVAQRLLGTPRPPAVVLVSSREARDFGPRIERCGAVGFLAKVDLSGTAVHELIGSR